MIVFVETNFVLELALEQPEHREALTILDLAETKKIELRIPAVSLVEPRWKLIKTKKDYKDLSDSINGQLNQMVRSAGFADLRQKSSDLLRALATKADLEVQSFNSLVSRLLKCAEVLSLTDDVLIAGKARQLFDLEPLDALVFAAVEKSLRSTQPEESVFANKDAKGFMSSTVLDDLSKYNCKVIPNFVDSLAFIQKRVI